MKYEKIPLSAEDENIYLEAFVAEKVGNFTRKAILVIPGGGYGSVCHDREGEPIAMAFMPYGYNAFVLHYSVGGKRPFPAQLIEASLAIKHIKDHAEEYNIDPEQVFTVGFSAGGHLSATIGTLWKHPAVYEAIDMPYGYNKPKGTMLVYPVIDDHEFSFRFLWCTDALTDEQRAQVRLSDHVDADTCPAFIMHTANDQEVNIKNALNYAQALSKAGHKFELHVYPDALHGIALGNDITECGVPSWKNDAIAEWVRLAAYWADHL
jgi:acetyl esterase/lipase